MDRWLHIIMAHFYVAAQMAPGASPDVTVRVRGRLALA